MHSLLKTHRVNAGLTRKSVYEPLKVTEETYASWETGQVKIPAGKIKALAKCLNVREGILKGDRSAYLIGCNDETNGDEFNYYGEASFHFTGGGEPLLLSISEDSRLNLYRDIQGETAFIIVRSLSNQTVIIRREAIGDLFLTCDAQDRYGPEHKNYKKHVTYHNGCPLDWEIIEGLEIGDADEDEHGINEVRRLKSSLLMNEDYYERSVACGNLDEENIEQEKEKDAKWRFGVFDLSSKITYQFSNGNFRSFMAPDNTQIFEAFGSLVDHEADIGEEPTIVLEMGDTYDVAFLNTKTVDYITLPSHKFDDGRVQSEYDEIEDTPE